MHIKKSYKRVPFVPNPYPENPGSLEWKRRSEESLKKILQKYNSK